MWGLFQCEQHLDGDFDVYGLAVFGPGLELPLRLDLFDYGGKRYSIAGLVDLTLRRDACSNPSAKTQTRATRRGEFSMASPLFGAMALAVQTLPA